MGVDKKIIRKILRQRDLIVKELCEWAETFWYELDEDGERSYEQSEEIQESIIQLAERLENNQCDENDYEDIVFHIYQINYNESFIKGWETGVDYTPSN